MRYAVPALLALALACRPHPSPPTPADTTVVVAPDTAAVDTMPHDTTCYSCDTVTAADTVHAPLVAGARGFSPSGLAIGWAQLPSNNWGGGPFNSNTQAIMPKYLGGMVRAAASKHMRLVIVLPRPLLTSNGQTQGRWSSANGCSNLGGYASNGFPNDSFAKYASVIVGMNIGDDYGDPHSWGGVVVDPSQVAEVTKCAKAKYPALNIGLRAPAAFYKRYNNWDGSVQYVWFQMLKARIPKNGTPKSIIDKQAADAKAAGVAIIGGVNSHACHTATDYTPCTAAELLAYGTPFMDNPYYCGFHSWKFDATDLSKQGSSWSILSTRAAALPARVCRVG